ncbi:DnaJ-like cysteine-rich domain-containing protein [Echinicola shivajiensis]|uniref:molecular chaperone DnaJ n=1 Tax=Echinicola shivajiensis TaxID=1035916 RepID=UPI001BFCCE66|nr:molecular chaperone DnaJ [Echinicola shivajiensis]
MLCLFSLTSFESTAQVQPNLGQTDRLMEKGKEALESAEYEKANYYFREIIKSGVPIPSEMPYFFAETLFALKQFDNSANFLNKYLQLNGFKADYYDEAKGLQKRLVAPLNEIRSCSFCDIKGYRYQTCSKCEGKKVIEQDCHYCKGKGIVGCSRCKATGLITKKNIFDQTEYFQCERCEGKGRLVCPFCKGSLKENSDCNSCDGFGKVHSDEICDHQEEKESI